MALRARTPASAQLLRYLLTQHPIENGSFFRRWNLQHILNDNTTWQPRKHARLQLYVCRIQSLTGPSSPTLHIGCTRRLRERIRHMKRDGSRIELLAYMILPSSRTFHSRDVVRCCQVNASLKCALCRDQQQHWERPCANPLVALVMHSMVLHKRSHGRCRVNKSVITAEMPNYTREVAEQYQLTPGAFIVKQ